MKKTFNLATRRQRLIGLLATLGLSLTAGPGHAMDLLQGFQLALDNDARYQAARYDAAASREAEPQAMAQLLPNIGINMARSQRNTGTRAVDGFGQEVHRQQEYISANYALSLRQPIYRRYNFALYKQAGHQVDSAEANLDHNLQDLMLRLSEAYFEALTAEDTLKLAQVQLTAYAAQRSYAERRFKSGQGTRTDIDDAQARYDMALANELEARQNIDYTRRQLQVIINQPVEQLATLAAERIDFTNPQPNDPEDWVRRGIEINAELRSLRANIEAAAEEVNKASAGHQPTVDLVAQRSRNASDSETNINQTYLTSSIGVQVNIPLFAGGYVSSQTRQAEANLEKTRQQYEARRREVDMAIRKEFQNVTQGVLKVRAQEQASRSAEQAVYSNQKGYQAGTRTQIDVLNAEQQRMNVRRDLTLARHQYILSRIRLLSLAGSLDEHELTLVNDWLQPDETTPDTAPEPTTGVLTQRGSTQVPQVPQVQALPHSQARSAADFQPLEKSAQASHLRRAPGTLLPFRVASYRCIHPAASDTSSTSSNLFNADSRNLDGTHAPSTPVATLASRMLFPLVESCASGQTTGWL